MKRRFSINLWMFSGSQINLQVVAEDEEIEELVNQLATIELIIQSGEHTKSERMKFSTFATVRGAMAIAVNRIEAILWNDYEWKEPIK